MPYGMVSRCGSLRTMDCEGSLLWWIGKTGLKQRFVQLDPCLSLMSHHHGESCTPAKVIVEHL